MICCHLSCEKQGLTQTEGIEMDLFQHNPPLPIAHSSLAMLVKIQRAQDGEDHSALAL